MLEMPPTDDINQPKKQSKKLLITYIVLAVITVVALMLLLLRYPSLVQTRAVPATPTQNQATENRVFPQTYQDLVRSGTIPATRNVLLVNIAYDDEKTPAFRVENTRRINGYVPQIEAEDNYSLALIGTDGSILSQTPVSIPFEAHQPPPIAEEKIPSHAQIEKKFRFTGTVEWKEGATQLQLLNPENLVAASAPLHNVERVNNIPSFHSIPGDQLKPQKSSWLQSFTPSTLAASDSGTIDIAFIGHDFTESSLPTFRSNAQDIASHLLTYTPFSDYTDNTRFYEVDNTTDLGCTYSGRRIVCDSTKVSNAVAEAGVPYDKIMVIVNNDTYGGSGYLGGTISVAYNGPWMTQVGVHELAHNFTLLDEYTAYAGDGSTNGKTYENCYADSPPTDEWSGISDVTYYLGCNYQNWYRGSSTSIMKQIDAYYFNTVSQHYLKNSLSTFAQAVATPTPEPSPTPTPSPINDTEPPTVTITGPAVDTTVQGLVEITASATDNTGLERVEFFVNGNNIDTDTDDPFATFWDSTQFANGSYTIEARAYDLAGNTGVDTIAVIVSNAADSEAPAVTITQPTSGTTLPNKGKVTIKAIASDNVGVTQMILAIDGQTVETCTSASCSYSWNVNSVSSGEHTITVTAQDAAGNIGTTTSTVSKGGSSDTDDGGGGQDDGGGQGGGKDNPNRGPKK